MTLVPIYYACSKCSSAWSVPLLTLALLAVTAGCAGLDSRAAVAPRVPFSELRRRPTALFAVQREPVVLVFEQGDRIPARFELKSGILETTPAPVSFELVASRRFYLLLRPDGMPRVSLDGVHFEEEAKNWFRLGFGVDAQRAFLDLGLGIRQERVTPRAR